jgi:hypothetical protein
MNTWNHKTWTLFSETTGECLGITITGSADHLELNKREGSIAIEGEYEPLKHALDLTAKKVVQAPKPEASQYHDWKWDEKAESWVRISTSFAKLQAIRSKRNSLLAESDWTQFPDSPLSPEKRAEWAAYRKALRDLPENLEDPESVKWPVLPT